MRKILIILAILLSFAVSVTAELLNRGTDSPGNRLIYDSDLNITWYDYTNSAAYWQTQIDWASALSINFEGNIYDDWRLPSTMVNIKMKDLTPVALPFDSNTFIC